MRKFITPALLVIALSVPVLAGDTGTPPCPPETCPPPPCTENCGNGATTTDKAKLAVVKVVLALIAR